MQTKLWLALFISHTILLIFSISIMLVASRGKLSRYGFKLAKNIQLKKVISWGLGLGIVSMLMESFLPFGENVVSKELSFLQMVILIWLYASICEEVFFRGLIQSSLSHLAKYGFTIFERRISLPVLISALLFAFVLGIVAGYHRERTGSLVPTILVHMFANVGWSFAGYLIGLFTMPWRGRGTISECEMAPKKPDPIPLGDYSYTVDYAEYRIRQLMKQHHLPTSIQPARSTRRVEAGFVPLLPWLSRSIPVRE